MAKHPKGHNCPTDFIYSDKKGKCINPNLEDENLNEYSEDPEDLKESGRVVTVTN